MIPGYDEWKTREYDEPPVCCECGNYIYEDEIESSVFTIGGIICRHCFETEEDVDVTESV